MLVRYLNHEDQVLSSDSVVLQGLFKYQKREPSGNEQTTETETVYSNKHDNFRGTQRLYCEKQLFEGASIA